MNGGTKNHYETLGIPKTAAAQEIKRAYFTLVKRYPPERFPEEFKAVRESYEILGNEQKRAEYDKPDNLSPEVRAVLETAGGYVRVNSLDRAAGFLKTEIPKYPDAPEIKARLAEVFERQGKKGLAAKLWEEIWEGLSAAHTERAFYAKRLAKAYSGRGWNKKASDIYEKALELDPFDAGTWESYVEMRYDSDEWDKAGELCERALTALKSAGKDSAKIRAGCVFFLAKGPEDADFVKEHLTAMKTILQGLPIGGWGLGAVDTAFEGVMQSENAILLPMIRELYDLSPRKAPNLDKKLERAQFYYELDKLDKNGFSDIVYDICLTMLQDPPGDERDLEMAAMEYHILDKLEDHRRELSRLKKEFPKLYGLHGSFFDEAQRNRDTAGLINKRAKKLNKYYKAKTEVPDGREEASAPLQTVRREAPKIGRNDPCPCGSGKKYKRCCGAGA